MASATLDSASVVLLEVLDQIFVLEGAGEEVGVVEAAGAILLCWIPFLYLIHAALTDHSLTRVANLEIQWNSVAQVTAEKLLNFIVGFFIPFIYF